VQVFISVCLIIKNEEKNLRRCLSSIKDIASQIVVVDTGSTDNSISVANDFSDQVYSYKWQDDFSLARNFCLDKATGDWILIVDGDEALDIRCQDIFLERIQVSDAEAYLLYIKDYSSKAQGLLDISEYQVRLFKNNKNYRYNGIISETISDSIFNINPSARIELAREISITHYGFNEADSENRFRLKRNEELINKRFFSEEEEATKNYYLGKENLKHNKLPKALEHFMFVYQNSERFTGNMGDLIRYMAIDLFLQNRVSEALDLMEHALVQLPDKGDLQYLKAALLKNNAQYALAYEAYKNCLQFSIDQFPYNSICRQNIPKVFYCLGSLSEYFMDKENALFFFLESIKYDPYMTDSLRRIILILDPRNNPEYTLDSLNLVFDLNDKSLQADLARMFYQCSAYQPALDIIRQLESYGTVSEKIRLIKGYSLLRSKQYSYAIEELKMITGDIDLYIKAQLGLMLYYWISRDYQMASACLKRIETAGADKNELQVLSLLFRGNGNKNVKVPGQSQAYLLVYEILDLLVELGEACQIDEAFQELSPITGIRPSRLLAELFFKYEKYDLAEEEFRFLIEMKNPDALVFYYLGKICWVKGYLSDAATFFNQTVANGLETPKIRWEAARLHQELALANLSAGRDLCPENADADMMLEKMRSSLLEI
jgi:Glycosyltransferases involved in cell wall biogenesis